MIALHRGQHGQDGVRDDADVGADVGLHAEAGSRRAARELDGCQRALARTETRRMLTACELPASCDLESSHEFELIDAIDS